MNELYKELEKMEESGIALKLDGSYLEAKKVVEAHTLCEKGTYMKDYVVDNDGKIKEVHFHKVKL